MLQYLARYTHRVAISNSRLQALTDGQVTFTSKDYAHGGKERRLTLDAVEFLRRFLQHVLPQGFVKVRHDGLLANGRREAKLAVCRWLLALTAALALAAARVAPARRACCPMCGVGMLVWVEALPGPGWTRGRRVVERKDTS